jgi:hypothetical protein
VISVKVTRFLVLASLFSLSFKSTGQELHDQYLDAWNDRLQRYTVSSEFLLLPPTPGNNQSFSKGLSRRQFIQQLPEWVQYTRQKHELEGKRLVLSSFIRMMRARPDIDSIHGWFESGVKSAAADTRTAMSSAESFLSDMERIISTNPDWLDELGAIPIY